MQCDEVLFNIVINYAKLKTKEATRLKNLFKEMQFDFHNNC